MAQSLGEFWAAHDWSVLQAATGWLVLRDEQDPARVVQRLKARDGEEYKVLFICDNYPADAPSVAFINDQGSKLDPQAWPRGDGEFIQEVKAPPNSFLCMPLTREGLVHHPDWRTTATAGAWNPNVHSLMDLFNRLQRMLNSDHYQGRGQ